MMFVFWCYHFYLTITNFTTNETFKWSEVKEELQVSLFQKKKFIEQYIKQKLKSKERPIYKDKVKEHVALRREQWIKFVKDGKKMIHKYNLGFMNNIKEVIFPKCTNKKFI